MKPDQTPSGTPLARDRKPQGTSRRDQIAQIAQSLFAEKGFDGTSIRDIAEAAGLTKPALYYHFQDKEALYEHVLIDRMTKLIESVEHDIASSDDPVERIGLYLLTHANRMDRDRDNWLMSRQSFLSITDDDRRARVTDLRDRFEHILRDLIQDAIEAGELDPETSPSLVSRMLLSSVNDIPRWLRPGGGLTASNVALSYVQIALNGMRVKPSR